MPLPLTHEQLRQAIISWMNAPGRNLPNELPASVKTAAERQFLRMFFHADEGVDDKIAELQEFKALILELKNKYPDIQV